MYLFDILLLGSMAFRNGITTILENTEILKVSPMNTPGTLFCDVVMWCFDPQVLHDCREIAACLMGQFGVKLNNVFDTQVQMFGFDRTAQFVDFHALHVFECNVLTSAWLRWQMSCASTQPRGASFLTALAL